MNRPKLIKSHLFSWFNELIFLLAGVKILLFHLFSSSIISMGVIFTTLGFLVIFYSFSYLFQNKIRLFYSYTANLLITFILIPNTLYLDYFSSPLTLSVFKQTTNLSGLGDSIFFLLSMKYLLYVIDLIVLPFVISRKSFIYIKNRRPLKAFLPVLAAGVMFVCLKPMKVIYLDHEDSIVKAYDSKDFLAQYGIFGHHALDGYYHVKAANFELSKEEVDKIDAYWAGKETDRSADSELAGFGKDKNLIMIQVESLQSFVINEKVNGQEITPTINKLLKNSIYFPRFYAQTIEGNSSDAEFLTQTSLFPLKTGSVFFQYPQNTYHSLPKLLNDNGYRTTAVHADEKTFWNRHNMYPALGFEEFVSIDDFSQDEIVGMGVGDKSMFSEWGKQLKKSREPFYSFIVTLSNHMPYELTEDKKSITLPPKLQDNLLGSYFQTVRYTDEALAEFLEELEEDDLLKNSIIVLYGDHNGIFHKDKKLLEDSWLNKKISFEEWYRKYAAVPFIIYNPEINGRVIDKVGGQIDVYPTVRTIMGLRSDNNYALGTDLLTENSGSVIIPSGGYVEVPLQITDSSLSVGLSSEEQDLIELSNLIIKGDYFEIKGRRE
jgi:lipoteichoic acid synthase